MTPDIELALAARAENIAIVRHALGGLGDAFDVAESKLSDIRLAVTEACANVVVHAYPKGQEGPMEILASKNDDELIVLVRDWGQGVRPRPDSPGLGLGLSLIAALAESVQLGHDPDKHTEVRMTFALSESGQGAEGQGAEGQGGEIPPNMGTPQDTNTRPGMNGHFS